LSPKASGSSLSPMASVAEDCTQGDFSRANTAHQAHAVAVLAAKPTAAPKLSKKPGNSESRARRLSMISVQTSSPAPAPAPTPALASASEPMGADTAMDTKRDDPYWREARLLEQAILRNSPVKKKQGPSLTQEFSPRTEYCGKALHSEPSGAPKRMRRVSIAGDSMVDRSRSLGESSTTAVGSAEATMQAYFDRQDKKSVAATTSTSTPAEQQATHASASPSAASSPKAPKPAKQMGTQVRKASPSLYSSSGVAGT
jgi:hypothetical protein